MNTTTTQYPSHRSLTLLSRLLIAGSGQFAANLATEPSLKAEVLALTRAQFEDLLALAQLNHVVMRGLDVIRTLALEENDAMRAEWAEKALNQEHERIKTAVVYLAAICNAFSEHDHGVAVIKSLDHWPDLGSDLDLYTDASPEEVCGLMTRRFNAEIEPRSWGDRLACKWNFKLPGLPESVEIHVGRLGQTGEQVEIASSVLKRARQVRIGERTFSVPSITERLLISTLQRMYRHFYFRLCDIVDSAGLAAAGRIDYADLRASAERAGIWKGAATYMQIVSDYVKDYCGCGLELPQFVAAAAQFGAAETYYARGFIRVPIMPQSARLYTAQLAGVLGKGSLHNGARLSLLPWLATAAAVGQKLTGSDKGIW
jgi:hypothetical protein